VTGPSFELVARLGRGGMGVVDLARDADGRTVALKRLTLHGSATEIARARERLLREAAVLRRLHHPNVVALLDVVDDGDEIVLVMPFMPGGSLAERVAQHGPAPPDEVERQAVRLLGALASAHAAGVVHRDIKPANILFDDRGEPCLADFGVALSHDQTHGLTAAGMVVGTPGFMSPEQARGEPVSPASDVFSLGATLLFAASGEAPYGQGDPGLLMVRAASGKVQRVPRSLPRSLRRLLRPTLDPRPERRPTAAALVSDHAAARAQPGAPRDTRRHRAIAGVILAAVLAVGAVVVAARWSDDPGGARAGSLGDAGGAQPDSEAAPDGQDGEPLVDRITARIEPADDVDTYPLRVEDNLQQLCDGEIEVRLDAPPGLVLHLEVRQSPGGEVVGAATSADGVPAVVTLGEQQCGGDDTASFDVVVRSDGSSEVASDYVLTRAGTF
jgi:Protein kinase domain